PARNVAVEQLLKGGRSPGGGMDAVSDGINCVAGEHQLRHFSMLLGHAVDVVAEIEREVSQVQSAFAAEDLFHREYIRATEHAAHEIERELVVSGRNRCVRGKDALRTHRFHVGPVEYCASVC